MSKKVTPGADGTPVASQGGPPVPPRTGRPLFEFESEWTEGLPGRPLLRTRRYSVNQAFFGDVATARLRHASVSLAEAMTWAAEEITAMADRAASADHGGAVGVLGLGRAPVPVKDAPGPAAGFTVGRPDSDGFVTVERTTKA